MLKLRTKCAKNVGIVLLLGSICLSASLSIAQLLPQKDSLFAYPGILQSDSNDDFQLIDYDEMRDVNGRDEIPVKKAKNEFVELIPQGLERDILIQHRSGSMEAVEVGHPVNADFAVIFIHGAGGSKKLGSNDWSFGGNFNRLKQLAIKNNGVYYSPSVSFDSTGLSGVYQLLVNIKKNSPQAKIILSCGSAGASICWGLANNADSAALLSGIVALGVARTHLDTKKSPAVLSKIPIVIAHGSKDGVASWKKLKKKFDEIKEQDPNYPIKFYLFNTGIHGTPIRMIDWRTTLNWILDL